MAGMKGKLVLLPFFHPWLDTLNPEKRQTMSHLTDRLVIECGGDQNRRLDMPRGNFRGYVDWVKHVVPPGTVRPKDVLVIFTNLCFVSDLLVWRHIMVRELNINEADWVVFGELPPNSFFVSEMKKAGRFDKTFDTAAVWETELAYGSARFLALTPRAVETGWVREYISYYRATRTVFASVTTGASYPPRPRSPTGSGLPVKRPPPDPLPFSSKITTPSGTGLRIFRKK